MCRGRPPLRGEPFGAHCFTAILVVKHRFDARPAEIECPAPERCGTKAAQPVSRLGPIHTRLNRGAIMRALTAAAMIIAFLTASAYAQENKGPLTARSDAEKQQDANIDKAYRAATDRGPEKPAAKADPWQTVRPPTPEKPKR
jgi:hypothetical protein